MVKTFFILLLTRIDIIYAHNVVAGFPSLLAAKLKGKPVVFDMDDILTGHSPNKLVRYFGQAIDYLTARYSDITIVMSESLESKLRSKNINNIKLVSHGVDLSKFIPLKEKKQFIVFSGGIEKDDGVLLIPEAAEKVLKKYPHEIFLFVGDGGELDRLKKIVKDKNMENNFVFKGWIDHDHIPYYLSKSIIGLVTNLETIATEIAASLRAYEYMAMKLPVIVPNLPGMLEQVGNGERGLIFKSGEAEDLADKIIMLLDSEVLRKTLGNRGRKYIEEKCDWDKNAKTIVEICESCISHL